MKPSGSGPWDTLLRLLAVRDRSEQEVRDRLRRKGFAAAESEAAIARARAAGYLDDARFARGRAAALSASGRAVGPRLRQELRRLGLTEATSAAAVSGAEAEHPPAEVLRGLVAKRFDGFSFQDAGPAEQARVVRFLQRRGFPLELILQILKEER